MGYSKKTTNYIKELRKFRDLPKNEKLKHMLKFQEQQNKINVEDVKVESFCPIGHSLPTTIIHKPEKKTVVKIK